MWGVRHGQGTLPSWFFKSLGLSGFSEWVFSLVFPRVSGHERSQHFLTEIINTNSSVPSGQSTVKRSGIIPVVVV